MKTVNNIAIISLIIVCFAFGAMFIDFLSWFNLLYILLFRRILGIVALGGLAFFIISIIIINSESEGD